MPWGPSKEQKKAAAARRAKILAKLDEHVAEIQAAVPLSRNEQLLRYLERTYEFGRRTLMVADDEKLRDELLHRLPHIRMKGGFNEFRILLEMQSQTYASPNQRKRHARALWAASKAKVPSSNFRSFVKESGGLNKLGDMAQKKRSSAKSPKPPKPVKSAKQKKRGSGASWSGDDSPPKLRAKSNPEDWTP